MEQLVKMLNCLSLHTQTVSVHYSEK